MLQIVTVIVAVYVALGALLFTFQRSMIYFPDTSRPTPAASGLADMTALEIPTEDGLSLHAWYKPAQSGRPTILFFQGNAGHIGHRGFKARVLLDGGVGLLLLGYRGYGGNAGSPSEEGLYKDGRAALRVLKEWGVPAVSVVLYGESIGSGIAVHLAHELTRDGSPPGAVILEAPFTSLPSVGAHHYPIFPVRMLARDRFDSLAKISRIGAPLLIVHGLRDRVVPVGFGQTLFGAASEPKESRWIDGAGHNDLHLFGGLEDVMSFINRVFP